MKISKLNNILFQKKLVAKAGVIKNDKPEKVNIYELEYGIDDDYFGKIRKDESWEDNAYLDDIQGDFSFEVMPCDSFFAIEDTKGNVLGLSEITRHLSTILLDYLETAPKYSINQRKRDLKYIGETMVSFIASLCKREGKRFEIPDIADRISTQKFYFDNCGFEDTGLNGGTMKNFDNLIAQNARHTDSSIELIG